MKAAVLKAPGEMIVDQVPNPECPAGGLLVEVRACSICATDIKMSIHGQRDLICPRILGHEVAGIVFATDSNSFKEGDRVQIAPGFLCGECAACTSGFTNMCKDIDILGFTLDGGFAQYITVPAKSITCKGVSIIPGNITFEEATLAEPLACCLNGQDRVQVGEGDTVLVWGAGSIGCLHTMLARARGAKRILLAEKSPERLGMATNAKPDRLIDSSREDIERIVKEETDGYGVDVLMISCPELPTESSVTDLLAPHGRVCFFSGLHEDEIHFGANQIHYRELSFVGAYGCTAEQNRRALELIASGEVEVDWLISKQIPLGQIREGIDDLVKRRAMKIVVTDFK